MTRRKKAAAPSDAEIIDGLTRTVGDLIDREYEAAIERAADHVRLRDADAVADFGRWMLERRSEPAANVRRAQTDANIEELVRRWPEVKALREKRNGKAAPDLLEWTPAKYKRVLALAKRLGRIRE